MKIVMQYFLRSGVFFIYRKSSTFLDLGSNSNVDQHKIIFPAVYSMMGFGKKKFFIKFGPLPIKNLATFQITLYYSVYIVFGAVRRLEGRVFSIPDKIIYSVNFLFDIFLNCIYLT